MENPVTDNMVTSVCAHCGNVIDITGLEPGDGITCPYCSKEFSITRQFGNFLLERQLGSGGMGTVYLGRDMTLNRMVAVKVLRPELVSDHKFMSTFLREAEITASMNHPNIVQVYAFGQHENVYYLVVEYISGGSLDDKIMNLGRITELEGIEIGIAVARGLECALQRGLIHRDIKPGNILFNANNTPKVVDFGLSLTFETTDHFDGEIWGTPYYVAPEKLERRPEDFRSDLYSLGATLFHAISGRPPYEGEDPNDVAMKHLSGNVVSLKAFVPDISDQTTYAVSKAMARHPEDRYESYAAFIAQLEDAKRRITDPNFRQKQQKEVVILETADNAKYKQYMVIGLVVIIVALVGLFIWKGSDLFQKKGAVQESRDLSDYVPVTSPVKTQSAPPAPQKSSPPPPTPTPSPAPVQNTQAAPAFTSVALPTTANVGRVYTFIFETKGSPAPTLSLTGTLPPGITFTPTTGVLTGTPTTAGAFNDITVTAANGVTPNATQTFSITVAPSNGGGKVVLAIKCGGPAYTASDGTVYAADEYFAGGLEYETSATIQNTNDPALYNKYRFTRDVPFGYAIPLPNGNYVVTLKFCETKPENKVGTRVANYALQGKTVLENFDIFATAGAYTPVEKSFNVTVTDGTLKIDVTRVAGAPRLDDIVIQAAQ